MSDWYKNHPERFRTRTIDIRPDVESMTVNADTSSVFSPPRDPEAPELDSDIASLADAPSSSSADACMGFADPTHRIGKLAAANQPPDRVSPDDELIAAVTVMLAKDFSQLPVMTSDRDVKGVISWASIAARLALGKNGTYAREFMDAPKEINAEASLFQAIPTISEHHYVLVRANDNRITGIVTAADLSVQFQQLSEPFLLLKEIEIHIRSVISQKLSDDELAAAIDPSDGARSIAEVEGLTFGDYIRLMEKPDVWNKLQLPIDRKKFCKNLDRVRTIRNEVMHFDPDGVSPDKLTVLRYFVRFLRRLHSVGVY